MIRLLGKLIALLNTALAYGCVATVAAQLVGVATLWSDGAFTEAKMKKYAAAIYGLDLTELPSAGQGSTLGPSDEQLSREELLASRVKGNPNLEARQQAIQKGADDIRALAQRLKTKRERYEIVKQGFNDLLAQLEQDLSATSLQEVRRTLEVRPPKLSKDLLMGMLQDPDVNPNDDALGDVLAIISALPQDKLKKVLGEFKSDDERQALHRILVAIGEIDSR